MKTVEYWAEELEIFLASPTEIKQDTSSKLSEYSI